MKRTPLIRKSPLKAKTPLKREKGVKRVNRKRREERFKIAFGDKLSWVQSLPCAVDSSECKYARRLSASENEGAYYSEAAHTKSRGAGGTSKHLIPLCTRHHLEQHGLGIKTFAAKYGLALHDLAEFYEHLWQQRAGKETAA